MQDDAHRCGQVRCICAPRKIFSYEHAVLARNPRHNPDALPLLPGAARTLHCLQGAIRLQYAFQCHQGVFDMDLSIGSEYSNHLVPNATLVGKGLAFGVCNPAYTTSKWPELADLRQGLLDPRTVAKLVFIKGDVSDGRCAAAETPTTHSRWTAPASSMPLFSRWRFAASSRAPLPSNC
mmetsp:Transcript_89347/g.238950  ORF Transcript_89347/g.238950 Transcript_89347/m.238950 type:complete len:179 (+) Transcript_89347:524-1060(+)